MLIGAIVLLSTSLLNQPPTPILADLYIGDRGPYRFLIDTGAQTSLIDSKLASDLRLKPEFQVEILTQHSKRLLPALKVRNLRIGATALPETELAFDDLANLRKMGIPVRGLLGINALRNVSFSLTPKTGRLEIEGGRPAGEVVPFELIGGRIALKARMGSEDLLLALDSGGGHVALFRTPDAMKKTPPMKAVMGTLEGERSIVPTTWTAPMTLGAFEIRSLPAAIVDRKDAEVDGLLPVSAFKTIYLDRRRGEAVLVR
jgi:predicted aspartyl protease